MTCNPARRGAALLCAWLALSGCGMKADLRRPEEAKARAEKRNKGLGRSFFGYTSTGSGASDETPPLQRPASPKPKDETGGKAAPVMAPALEPTTENLTPPSTAP